MLDETLAAVASPLFGSFQLGKPFDDAVSTIKPPIIGLRSLSIAYGPFVFGIQASYLLQNGGTYSGVIHGTIEQFIKNSTVVHFQDSEQIQRISGAIEQTYGYITQLKLYTNDSKGVVKVYGPFGPEESCGTPFTIAGAVTGLFGRSDKYLNAIGVYTNATMTSGMYKRTPMIGGIFGLSFDDYPALLSGHAELLNITINSGAYIFGLGTGYRLPNGTHFIGWHGQLGPNSKEIKFSNSEKIVQVDMAVFSLFVNYLMFSTLDSRGVRRVYGPFGDIPQSNIITIYGTVHAFYGRVGMDHTITAITGLGFYI